LKLIIVINS